MTKILRIAFEIKLNDKSLADFLKLLGEINANDLISGEFEFFETK